MSRSTNFRDVIGWRRSRALENQSCAVPMYLRHVTTLHGLERGGWVPIYDFPFRDMVCTSIPSNLATKTSFQWTAGPPTTTTTHPHLPTRSTAPPAPLHATHPRTCWCSTKILNNWTLNRWTLFLCVHWNTMLSAAKMFGQVFANTNRSPVQSCVVVAKKIIVHLSLVFPCFWRFVFISKRIKKEVRDTTRLKRRSKIQDTLETFKGIKSDCWNQNHEEEGFLITHMRNDNGEMESSRNGIANTFAKFCGKRHTSMDTKDSMKKMMRISNRVVAQKMKMTDPSVKKKQTSTRTTK